MIFDKVLGQTTKFEAHCFKAWTQNQLKAAQTPLTALPRRIGLKNV